MIERALITGGTGKTGRLVAAQLIKCGIDARIASRRPRASNHVHFDWNEPSIRFYESLGARALKEWFTYRLSGEALEKVAARA